MKNKNLTNLVLTLTDHKISSISVGLHTYQDMCLSFNPSEMDIVTNTINFKLSPIAYVYGIEIYLNAMLNSYEFKFGIKKDNKINWSIPIKLTTTPQELEKIIKLKNYW